MDKQRANQLRSIFDAAAELPEAERWRFVASSCEGDEDLAREIHSLLGALTRSGDVLEHGAVPRIDVTADADPRAHVPDKSDPVHLGGVRVGGFTVIGLIGRGGTGSVYAASQQSPSRRVALKLLQSWTMSPDRHRRFVEEANILARLQHPGIAQVFAAGDHALGAFDRADSGDELSAERGSAVPWIAMELIENARTLIEYCVESKLGLSERLATFTTVCDAVHYGHTQGVIHRDLKPQNILVGPDGVAKVIDFGVARAIALPGASLAAQANTVEGAIIGTLRYMSPEQCDGRAAAADTRSDVYALGVVLYELLTGAAPYQLDTDSMVSAARTVCETPPRPPRTVVSSLPRDIETIVLKSIEKDPSRRYQSAAELAADVRRFMADEPILARPSTAMYRLSKFARRRPALMALAMIAVIGVIVGVIGMKVGLSREREALRESEHRKLQAEHQAWLANLFAADSAIRNGDGGAAINRLDAIAAIQRGWEWHYLHALADTSASQWQITREKATTFLSPSGRSALCHYDDDRPSEIINPLRHDVIARVDARLPSGTAAWSNDERLIALSLVKEVVIIDARNGSIIRRISQDASRFSLGTAFSPDGSLLAVGLSNFAGVEVYNVPTGERVFSKSAEGWTFAPAFSPDGRKLAWFDAMTVQTVDTQTWKIERPVPTFRPSAVEPAALCFLPDGRSLAAACGVVIQIIDVQSAAVRATLRGHAQRIMSIACEQSGDRIITSSVDRTVRVWNVATGELLTTLLGHESPTGSASFIRNAAADDPNAISVDGNNRVRTWNLRTNGPKCSDRLDPGSLFATQLDFSADGTRLRVAADTSLITFTFDGRPVVQSRRSFESGFINVIPGKELMLHNIGGEEIALKSTVDDSRLWTIPATPPVVFVTSPDGLHSAWLRNEWEIAILRLSDGVEISRIITDKSGFHRPVFSPDGKTIATLEFSGALRLWEVGSGSLITQIAEKADRGHGLCWSNDGSLFAYAHSRDGVTVLDARTYATVTKMEGVGGLPWSIAISPDKTRLAVGAQDRITHLYEIPSGDELLQLRDHTGTVMSLAWSPNGAYLVSGGYDKQVFVYRSNPK